MACITVLAGTNGAGKSSVGGAMLRNAGGSYFNPDEVAAALRDKDPTLDPQKANATAWQLGVRLLRNAMLLNIDHYFETTLGGDTITALLHQALDDGHEVRIWYAALDSPERHIARVAARVGSGGHDIPEEAIVARYDDSRRNLISLLPRLTELKVFDNSFEADPAVGAPPLPRLVLHWLAGTIVGPGKPTLEQTPQWAKAIVAQALKSPPRGPDARTLEELDEGLVADIRKRHPKP